MGTKLRIATFNLENLDETTEAGDPALENRIGLMRPQLVRLEADVLCLQEIHSQERRGKRRLSALEKLLEETPYAGYERASTFLEDGSAFYRERNLVILSRHEILDHHQYKHDYATPPAYRLVTAEPSEGEPRELSWERPILHAEIRLPDGRTLNV